MSSAQLDIQPLDEATAASEAAEPFVLKQQVAERLAAHRARHSHSSAPPTQAAARPASTRPRARIAAAVAERYAHSQSYRAFLAAEAERAIQEAQAAAEVAARSAQAVADAQNQLLAELDQWTLTPPPLPQMVEDKPDRADAIVADSVAEPPAQVSSAGLTVRLYEDIRQPDRSSFGRPNQPWQQQEHGPLDEDERLALEDEIAFRQSPTFEDPVAPIDIPANLIEFPRQLVASRRARPRIAEGPLRDEAEQAHDTTQLRIFEVEPLQISTEPAAESLAPEWSSILLGALPAYTPAYTPPVSEEAPLVSFNPAFPPQTATLSLRLMAGIVDVCIVLGGVLAFAAAFALTLAKLPGVSPIGAFTPQTAAIATGGTLAILMLLYQVLFFTFSEATPGMRYARIGLCTFGDDNPTRKAMRRRILASVLSACPLGIGFLWAWLDDDRLGWHDRISRMYQRSY